MASEYVHQKPPMPLANMAPTSVDMQGANGVYYMNNGQSVQAPYSHVQYHNPSAVGPAPNSPSVTPSGVYRNDAAVPVHPAGIPQNDRLVMEVPVPPQLGDQFDHQDPSFRSLRYTACTCDPNRFIDKGYTLRQKGQQIELLVVVTMYNEGPRLFIKTMQGLHNNIRQMLEADPKNWGPDGWRKVLVVIVSDGRKKINQDTLSLIALMGAYQDGLMRQYVGERKTQGHLFEVTTQTNFEGVPEDGTRLVTPRDSKKPVIPLQFLFCLKEENAKKINSHRWFFNAFAATVKPNVCILLDVGTKPQTLSIYRLWRVFYSDLQVGGACGEIAVEGTFWSKLNPIIASQNFEYKMSNILDKPIESVGGYISVLPGAFSAYRYRALEGRPLKEYFKGEVLHDSDDVFAGNMYLAEDRILCFELVAKKNANWLLRYEKNSQAITDAPDNFPELISQRRRWLNGSTFAFLYAFANMTRIYSSGQSFFRKVGVTIELVYMFINFLFAYLSLAHFYIAFHFLVDNYNSLISGPYAKELRGVLSTNGKYADLGYALRTVILILRPVYVLALCITFIASLGNRPQSARRVFQLVIALFGLISIVMLYIVITSTFVQFQTRSKSLVQELRTFYIKKLITEQSSSVVTLIAIASTYGIYMLSSIMYLEWYHPIFNLLQYTVLLPTYVNVLQIYAYCNISDLSWGTKGDTGGSAAHGGAINKGAKAGQVDELLQVALLPASEFFQKTNQRFTVLQHEMKEPDHQEKQKDGKDDNFKKFRTYWLLTWIFVNGVLVGGLLSPSLIGFSNTLPDGTVSNHIQQGYLVALFICVLILSIIRMLGSTVYWIGHIIKNFTGGFACC